MPTSLGTPADTTIFLQGFSNHFTHVEFEAKAAVKKGQPVKLDTDGTITPLVAGDNRNLCIGLAHADADAGELVTVVTKGLGVVFAYANAALSAGPVQYDGFYTTGGRCLYIGAVATDADMTGWALDVATAQYNKIRVLVAMS